MSDFKRYNRLGYAEAKEYNPAEVLGSSVSISAEDIKNGSPKVGDMIARNPKNHKDQWLIAKDYWADNFEQQGVEIS